MRVLQPGYNLGFTLKSADKLGLVFMAMAGYDPRVAPTFCRPRLAIFTEEVKKDMVSRCLSQFARQRTVNRGS